MFYKVFKKCLSGFINIDNIRKFRFSSLTLTGKIFLKFVKLSCKYFKTVSNIHENYFRTWNFHELVFFWGHKKLKELKVTNLPVENYSDGFKLFQIRIKSNKDKSSGFKIPPDATHS